MKDGETRRGRAPHLCWPGVRPPPHQPSPAARLLRLPLKGGVILEACIRRASITPPLRGSRREGGARSRAGGGQRVSTNGVSAARRRRQRVGRAPQPRQPGVRPPPHQPSPAARLLRLPLKGGVILEACIRRASITPPLEGESARGRTVEPEGGRRGAPANGAGSPAEAKPRQPIQPFQASTSPALVVQTVRSVRSRSGFRRAP